MRWFLSRMRWHLLMTRMVKIIKRMDVIMNEMVENKNRMNVIMNGWDDIDH